MLSSAHPIQVLVCDPSADKNVKLIRLLADCGQVNVKQVDDPQKFSLAAAHIMPDLLVLGDNFPEVPTIQLIRQLKKAPLLSKIPIVLHAKNTNESFVNPILAQGVTATIPYPGTQRDVVEALGRYFRLEQSPKVLQLMQEAPFFEGFTREDLRHFVRLSIARKYQSGETICSQGDVAESLFVMLSGTAEVIIANDQRGALVIPLTAGSGFGEVGMMDHKHRSATCLATTDCLVLEIGRGVLDEHDNPAVTRLYKRIAEVLARRLRNMRTVIDEQVEGRFREQRPDLLTDTINSSTATPNEDGTPSSNSDSPPTNEEEAKSRGDVLISPLATPTAIALALDERVTSHDEYEVLVRKVELRSDFIGNKINDTTADMIRKKLYGYWTGSKLSKHNPHRLWSAKSFIQNTSRLKHDLHMVVLCPSGDKLYSDCYFALPLTQRVIGLPETGCAGTFLGSQEAIDRYLTARSLSTALKGDLELAISREWCNKETVEYLTHTLADVRPETLFVVVDQPDGRLTRQLREVYPEHQVVTIVQGVVWDPEGNQGLFTCVETELRKTGHLVTKEEFKGVGFYEGETFFLPDLSIYYAENEALGAGGYVFGTIAAITRIGPDYSGRTWGSAGGAKGAVKAARARYGLKGAQSPQEMADAINWADQ